MARTALRIPYDEALPVKWDWMKADAARSRMPRGLESTANGRVVPVATAAARIPRWTGRQSRGLLFAAVLAGEVAAFVAIWIALVG